MIPKECKRLAEVDFPIAEVSKHSAREKSIRHGHPSTLHLWWARRPLAACRAMLLALLLPDPCDLHCPDEFKKKARSILAPLPQSLEPDDDGLRRSLLQFIGDFSNWDLSSNTQYIKAGRELVKAAHGEETPLVVDPFAGGGSIPLEALRLGCDAFASDLNPVACLILKVMLEDIPRHGPKLAEELRHVGGEIKKKAEKELAEFYPKDPDGSIPIVYLWARTVKCESPNCGAEIPLIRSFWLCKKAGRKRALKYKVVRIEERTPHVDFEIFKPSVDNEVPEGTITRAKATCLCCNQVLPPVRVRAQLSEQHGGADVLFDNNGMRIGGARIFAVVTQQSKIKGRNFRLATDCDYTAIFKAHRRINIILNEWEQKDRKDLYPIPDEPLPKEREKGSSGFRVLLYGMETFGDLFMVRQKLTLIKLINIVTNNRKSISSQIIDIVGLSITRLVDYLSAQCIWHIPKQLVAHTFGRQALPITWDFCEITPFSEAPGNYLGAINWIAKVIERYPSGAVGQVQLLDAANSYLPDRSVDIFFTDPPYYDAIAYADLSDFFLVWLKRTLKGHTLLHDPFDHNNCLSPKKQEAIQDPSRYIEGRKKDRTFYETSMAGAFLEGRRILRNEGIGSVVFAHKTTEGWEALLSGIIRGGWIVTGSWPIATEMSARLIARETAALATSIHLVCRPRSDDSKVGDWGEVLRELPNRVGDWMERLQGEGIRGADLVFACIGPALEIFSQYSRVETAEGREVKLAEYLQKIWEVVGRTALEQVLGTEEARARNGVAGVLEEDARLTALFLWTLQSTKGKNESDGVDNDDENGAEQKSKTKGFSLIFDVVRRFAQPLGIDLPIWEDRIIKTEKGVVKLLPVSDRAKQLFGEEGTKTVAEWIEKDPNKNLQQVLFPELEEMRMPQIRGRGRKRKIMVDPSAIDNEGMNEATTLDRVHAAMLLQSSGQANALRALVKAEADRGPEFIRLANALSALYPKNSEEKRLLDAMLLVVPK